MNFQETFLKTSEKVQQLYGPKIGAIFSLELEHFVIYKFNFAECLRKNFESKHKVHTCFFLTLIVMLWEIAFFA